MTHIWLFFQKDTTRPDKSCEELLIPEALAKLGEGPLCIWETPRALKVFFGTKATLLLGEELGLRTHVLLDYTRKVWNERTTKRVLRPEKINPPLAILSAPSFVGSCGGLSIDASSSSGSYGRDLKFTWLYSGPTTKLSTYVPSLSINRIEFVASNLTAGLHKFTVRIENWIGDAANSSASLTKLPAAIPKIVLPCPGHIHVKASEELVIRARIAEPFAGESGSGDDEDEGETVLRVKWSQLPPNTAYLPESSEEYRSLLFPFIPLHIPVRDSSFLTLPKNSLRMGANYALQLRASIFGKDGSFRAENNETIFIQTVSEPVTAWIKGGARRDVYASPDAYITFDGSSSFDPVGEGLTFKWEVLLLPPRINYDFGPMRIPEAAWVSTQNSSVLNVPKSILLSSKSYLIRLNVTTVHTFRMGITEQVVDMSKDPIPLVQISATSSAASSTSVTTTFVILPSARNFP
eukprot:jgi/Bigna1/127682/aug1.5_g2390